MNQRAMIWWRTRTPREQRLLLVMGAIATLVLAWLLIVRPLGDALSDARERHGAAVVDLANAKGQAAAIRAAASRAPSTLTAPVDALVSQSATEAGFPVTRLERQGTNQATLVLEAVRPQAYFGWLHRMEQAGFAVESLTATTNSDRTLAVQVTLRGRGA
jgi:general secretion pathway protein M